MTARRVALVTGAARGIGRAEATALARAGYDVAVAYQTTSPTAVHEELVEAGVEDPLTVKVDLTDSAAIERLRGQVADRYGRLDVLVNNAGAGKPWAGVEIADLTDEGWRSLFEANVSSAFYCMREFNELLSEGPGLIVNTSSIHGVTGGRPGWVAYGAAKAALVALSRGAAREMRATVVCLVLGMVDTEQLRGSLGDRINELERQNPIGRMIRPREVASFVVSLANLSSEAINGSVFELSGGRREYVFEPVVEMASPRD